MWRAAIGYWRNALQLGGAAFLTDSAASGQPWPDRATSLADPQVGPGAGARATRAGAYRATRGKSGVGALREKKADGASNEKPAAVGRRAVVRALWGVGGARRPILAEGSILSIIS